MKKEALFVASNDFAFLSFFLSLSLDRRLSSPLSVTEVDEQQNEKGDPIQPQRERERERERRILFLSFLILSYMYRYSGLLFPPVGIEKEAQRSILDLALDMLSCFVNVNRYYRFDISSQIT